MQFYFYFSLSTVKLCIFYFFFINKLWQNKRFEIGAVRYRQKPSLEKVKKLASAGMNKREISKEIGISLSAVNWYLYHYGIDYVKCDGSYVWRNDMKTLFGGNR